MHGAEGGMFSGCGKEWAPFSPYIARGENARRAVSECGAMGEGEGALSPGGEMLQRKRDPLAAR